MRELNIPGRSGLHSKSLEKIRRYTGDHRAMNRARAINELSLVAQGVRLRLSVVNLICKLLPPFTASTIRTALYRLTGMRLGRGVAFMSAVRVSGSGPNPCTRLEIGDGSIVSTDVLFNLEGPITIGSYVNVSQFVRIYTSKHTIGGSTRRFNPAFEAQGVEICDGAWLGTGVIVLPGITVGAGSVVSAGSVVTRSVPPDCLVSGVPAEVVKQLHDVME
jgi:serine acetyltransferase